MEFEHPVFHIYPRKKRRKQFEDMIMVPLAIIIGTTLLFFSLREAAMNPSRHLPGPETGEEIVSQGE